MDEILRIYAESSFFRQIFLTAFLASWVVAFVSFWVTAIVWLFLPFNATPGSIRGWLMLNPLNILFFPKHLTPRGQRLRRWMFCSAVTFLAALSFGILSGLIARLG